MDEINLTMLRLTGAGYCCSQILVMLGLEEMGRQNPDLIRAAGGLCKGMGNCEGPCGVLTGAACLVSLHAGKGMDDEQPEDRLPLMLDELTSWFHERVASAHGGISCREILGGECGGPNPAVCGNILAETYARVREILVENGVDPSQGREASVD